ncbi:YheC/YheD family protein [Paenibacillus hexagrammi]|uniref:YheC/YheD family protein n=1 Tax=Paenibacillus hexagrammi TaxID=2908839 RepID=A0ABY3SFN7_9BACL|nr:YheC/YheD family protein [Paenibacillus sp. YPD9-1]UJF32255.1 YheC/YheD family protein [Paenibacillus sp. YPD9-1]
MTTERPLSIAMMCERRAGTRLKFALAAIAKLKGVEFFYFLPEDVDMVHKTIQGQIWIKDEWVMQTFDYPDAIHDRAARRGKKYAEVYEAFADIPMTTNKPAGVGNKMEMYRLLLKDGRFKNLLIPSLKLTRVDQVFQWLERRQEVIMKPVGSYGGHSLYYMKKEPQGFTVIAEKQRLSLNEHEFTDWITGIWESRKQAYLIQPYIRSETKEGNPFDIRIHLAKGEGGEWHIARVYPRIGEKSGKTSNLSTGGFTAELDTFYRMNLGKKNLTPFAVSSMHWELTLPLTCRHCLTTTSMKSPWISVWIYKEGYGYLK